MNTPPARVAIVHDYLTQCGGAERVVRSILRAFPDAPLYTALYDAEGTYPEFADADVRPLGLQRLPLLRHHHRWGLPLYAPLFSQLHVDADVLICSSSGWAHGAKTNGRKIVYCFTPARWLYLPDQYLRHGSRYSALVLQLMSGPLRKWDLRAAMSADLVLTTSMAVRDRISHTWRREATILPPPISLDETGAQQRVAGVNSGYLLVVSRLLPYKNVDAVIAATAELDLSLVIVGDGPDHARLRSLAHPRVTFLHNVSDSQLRWLYANSAGVIAAAHEDFGLTPLEANAFGRPVAALRAGGFLDTVRDGITGLFFETLEPLELASTVQALTTCGWDEVAIKAHSARYSEARFVAALRALVGASPPPQSGGSSRLPEESAKDS